MKEKKKDSRVVAVGDEGVMRIREIREYFGGVGRTTLWRWMNDPEMGFPKKKQLGPRAVGYDRAEIKAWWAARPQLKPAA